MQPIIEGELSLLLLDLQALEQGTGISSGHFTAAAAAPNVLFSGLAQQYHLLSGMQRKHLVFVFQQDDALACRLTGQLNVFRTAGYHCAV